MPEIAISALLVVVGFSALYFGAIWLVGGSASIARKLRISELVIGLTIVSFGTSTPELVVSVAAALQDQPDIALGNIVGSNIANIGLVMGASAIMLPLLVQKKTVRKQVPIMIGIVFLLIPLSLDGEISRVEGIILVSALFAFIYFSYREARKEESSKNHAAGGSGGGGSADRDHAKRNPYLKSALLIGVGMLLLFVGSSLTVENAVVIAKSLGISERIIGITIIAIGTSLPELITSVVAARKAHGDISVGNIIGSNIYNVLAIAGIASALTGLTVNAAMFTDYWIMMAFCLVALPIMRSRFRVSRTEGSALLGAYAAYLILLYIFR